jgi:small-conductance mechanosensitive channel
VELPQIGDAIGDLSAIGIAVVAIVIGVVTHWVVFAVAERLSRQTSSRVDESFLEHTKYSGRFLFAVAALFLSSFFMYEEAQSYARGAAIFFGIIGLGWFLVALMRVGSDAILSRFPDEGEPGLEERQVKTQLEILQRFGAIIIWLVAVAIALLTIPGVQALAASLLAGAGVMGIVLGVAAGPLIGNLIAGVQIAFTQPIKVGDVVVIEGEWGHIGEITAAYVVVYIWDKRRLVVPLSDIVNKPVENWTRKTTDLLGTVKLYLDYRAPIDEIRTEYKRILDESGLWDGEAWSVLVTGADDRTITVRALYSAPDASNEWSLRCLVREKLVTFLQQTHPQALPVQREIHVAGKPELGV